MAFLAEMTLVARPSCFLVLYVTSAFAGQQHMIVKPGEDVTLQCQSHTDSPITVLQWIRPDLKSDDYVFFYRNDRSYEKYQHPSFRGRVELKDPEMKNGDVSVILKNVTINDAGTYECRVIINIERFNNSITLTVSEPGHTEEGGDKEGGDEEGGKTEKFINNRGNKDVPVGLVAGLSVVLFLFLCFIGFIIYKNHQKLPSYQPPPEKAAEQQQV